MNDHLCLLLQFRRVNIIIEVGGVFFLVKLEVFTFIKDRIADSEPYMPRTYSQVFNENKYD